MGREMKRVEVLGLFLPLPVSLYFSRRIMGIRGKVWTRIVLLLRDARVRSCKRARSVKVD